MTSENNDEEEVEEEEKATGCWYFLEQKPNNIAAVFSMQGVGMLLSPLLIMILIQSGVSLETTWRFCLGIGAVPSAVAFFFRWRMHESLSFKRTQRNIYLADSVDTSTTVLDSRPTSSASSMSGVFISPPAILKTAEGSPLCEVEEGDKKKNELEGVKPPSFPETVPMTKTYKGEKRRRQDRFSRHMKHSWNTLKRFRWVLIGTSMTWFLIDVTFYGTVSVGF